MKNYKPFILVCILITLIWGLSWFLLVTNIGESNDRGAFGDMFGAINSLFSGIAMAGVVFAIIMQKKELELQRDELELTRKELSKTAKASSQQAKIQSLSAKIDGYTAMLNTTTNRINQTYQKIDHMASVKYDPVQLSNYETAYLNYIGETIGELEKINLESMVNVVTDEH